MAAEETHYETLCAVIQGDDSGWQAFSERTLHNIPLRIIHLSGLDGFVAQPQGDYRAIHAGLQEFHRGGVSQNMWADPLRIQRRTGSLSNCDMLGQQILHSIRAELAASRIRENNLVVDAARGFSEPRL